MNVVQSAKATQQDQIEELSELKKIIGQDSENERWLGLAKHPERLLRVLMAREIVSTETAFTALYFDRDANERPSIKTVAVQMSQLRKFVQSYTCNIESQWGAGYYITKPDKARLKLEIEEYTRTHSPDAKRNRTMTLVPGITPGAPLPSPYKIDRGIPMPSGKNDPKFPWADLMPGDSFFVPKPDNVLDSRHLMQSVGNLWRKWKKNNKSSAQFASRRVTGGLRVWRVK